MTEAQHKDIELLKKDVEYFSNLEFIELSNKFNRDLNIINALLKTIEELKLKENNS